MSDDLLHQDVPEMRLAVMAKILRNTGGFDCDVDAYTLDWEAERFSAEVREKAHIISRGVIEDSFVRRISPIEPTLLGNWLVLRWLQDTNAANTQTIADIFRDCWRLAPEATSSFVEEITQEYPKRHVVKKILEVEIPDKQECFEAFASCASEVSSNLLHARTEIPAGFFCQLERAAARDCPSSGILGQMAA